MCYELVEEHGPGSRNGGQGGPDHATRPSTPDDEECTRNASLGRKNIRMQTRLSGEQGDACLVTQFSRRRRIVGNYRVVGTRRVRRHTSSHARARHLLAYRRYHHRYLLAGTMRMS